MPAAATRAPSSGRANHYPLGSVPTQQNTVPIRQNQESVTHNHRHTVGDVSKATQAQPKRAGGAIPAAAVSTVGPIALTTEESVGYPPRTLPHQTFSSSRGRVASSHSARKLSASFSGGGPLFSNPTVASFDINAVTRPDAARNDENKPPSNGGPTDRPRQIYNNAQRSSKQSPDSRPSLVTTTVPDFHEQPAAQGHAEKKRLPKSRTLAVLSNITASLSRTSLTGFSGNERKSSKHSVPSRNISSSSTVTTGTFSTVASRPPSPTFTTGNPLIITTAQPSQYWSGRFLSLHDRFHNEELQPQSLSILVSAHASRSTILPHQQAAYQGRGNLPLSNTTALERYGPSVIREANLLSDDDNRCLRVFMHLDSLCATPEAQQSLHAWQETYARVNHREALLPEGRTMDRGFVARLFGGRRSTSGSQPEKKVIEGKKGRTGKRAGIF
ncbi:hypothetical protein CPLU01_09991 [Colletotrichum plurivorum]|uniref:Uncharacterized protein n=1 Tax=Colletotrichum plurivorum TaxID=2175906 RepID=A0A8H6NAY4_9PEZI|nr:hypothetical protein CPLU01_09991 [Colletotrichum plurivorum]